MDNIWQTKRLGDVCEISAGNSAPQRKELFLNGEYLFFRTSDIGKIRFGSINDSADKLNQTGVKGLRLFKKGTLLFPKSGASTFLNHRVLMANDGYVSSHLATIKANDNILDHRYLLYFSSMIDSRDLMQDQNYPSLRLSDIEQIQINLPALKEQKRIVRALDDVFENVKKAKENAEKNLANARELFNSYLQDSFSLLNSKYKQRRIKDVAKIYGGFAFKSTWFNKKGKYQVLRIGNIRRGQVRRDENPVFIEHVDENILERSLLKAGDVVITQTGTRKKRDYGYTTIIDQDNYLLNQRLSAIRFDNVLFRKYFLYFSWSEIFRDQFFKNETGTVGQGNVGINAIIEALMPVPDMAEQSQIVAKLDTLSLETKKLEVIYKKKLADLDELKKSVLQKAFKGEL